MKPHQAQVILWIAATLRMLADMLERLINPAAPGRPQP